jgi:hypothetical protein
VRRRRRLFFLSGSRSEDFHVCARSYAEGRRLSEIEIRLRRHEALILG